MAAPPQGSDARRLLWVAFVADGAHGARLAQCGTRAGRAAFGSAGPDAGLCLRFEGWSGKLRCVITALTGLRRYAPPAPVQLV